MIYLIVGTRPNYIKAFPIYKYFKKNGIDIKLIHSNQHYDNNLNRIFFDELGIDTKEVDVLNQKGNILDNLLKLFKEKSPNYVMVVGDVNTSLYGAMAAVENNIPVIHIEAGLRSGDLNMIEETNRKAIDKVSSYLFCTELGAVQNLKNENIHNNVYFVGNTMIDTLVDNLDKIKYYNYKSEIANKYNVVLKRDFYIVCTLHRQSNVDNPEIIDYILRVIDDISINYRVIIPLHPRTANNINKGKYKNIIFVEPLSYIKFLSLIYDSKCVITDSGGIQEETSFLNKQCITLRRNTERPITIIKGTNKLCNIDYEEIMDNILRYKKKESVEIDYWDGKASERILEIINSFN